MATTQEPESVARHFLEAMEARDLERAKALLAPSYGLFFPSGRFASLDEMVGAAGGRYRWVLKRIEASDVLPTPGGAVVYLRGTLYGCNNAGAEFGGVRFIDRFEITGGLISRQDVWNDLAESGVLDRGTAAGT